MYAEKDSSEEEGVINSQFQYEQSKKDARAKRNDPSIFRRKLLNVLSANKTSEVQNCDDSHFCQTKLNGSDGAIDHDFKNNSSKSKISFRISKNETAKLSRKNNCKFLKDGCKSKKSKQRKAADSNSRRYGRAITKPCKKRNNKKKFSNYDDENINNYDVIDEDQDADFGNDENQADFGDDENQNADFGNEEQDEKDIDLIHGFDEDDDNDKVLDDQDDIANLDVDNYNENESFNINGNGKKGKGKIGKGKKFPIKDYDSENQDNYKFYNSDNDEVHKNEDYDDIFDNGENEDDNFNEDEGGLSKIPVDDDYDEDDNGIGGVPEDTGYDYNEVTDTSGNPEKVYDYDHYEYNYDHTEDGQREEETEYDDSKGDGFHQTRGTEIPGGLGKYFVYVNCTTCKIKSQLVVLAGKKTSKPPKVNEITTTSTKRRTRKGTKGK
ncbi:hypothetical protein HNY73_003010 [Argiope bruennichi]|uniref:Uncharacterized protein n=2 Tax=Argiope bruennichi TaxID=94029 RepID=A0A8T0FXY9_ARGBR|nr:hypothetical protein HNY73_003010 [Argiope bruennichi]